VRSQHAAFIVLFTISSSAAAQAPETEPEIDPLVAGGSTTTVLEAPATALGEVTTALAPSTFLGVGAGSTLGGAPALWVHKYPTDRFGLQIGMTFDLASYSAGPADAEIKGSIWGIGAATYGSFRLKSLDDFAFNAIVGAELGRYSVSYDPGSGSGSVSESGFDLRLGTGLQAEIFIFPRLSLYAQIGMSVGFLGDVSTARESGAVPSSTADTSSVSVQLGPRSLAHSFGLIWWL